MSNNASCFSQCNQAHFAHFESLPPSNWPLAGGGGGTRGLQLLSLFHQSQLHTVAHFNLALPVVPPSAHPEPGCAGWDITPPPPPHPPLPSHLQGSLRSKCCLTSQWPNPPSEYQSKASLLAKNLPKGLLSLYPSIRSEFQIRIKVCVRPVLSDIHWSVSLPARFLFQKTFHLVSSFSSPLEMSDTSEIAFN